MSIWFIEIKNNNKKNLEFFVRELGHHFALHALHLAHGGTTKSIEEKEDARVQQKVEQIGHEFVVFVLDEDARLQLQLLLHLYYY